MTTPGQFSSIALATATAALLSVFSASANAGVVEFDVVVPSDMAVWEGDSPEFDGPRFAFTADNGDPKDEQAVDRKTGEFFGDSYSISIPEASTWAMILLWTAGLAVARVRKSRPAISIHEPE